MTPLRKTLAWLNDIETLVCEWLLATFVVLLFAQIVSRQVFNHSIAWSEELSTYMFVWFAYLGAVVAAKMSAHNRVTVHFQFMPKWLAKSMMTLADLLWVAFNLYFVWLSYDFVFNRMNLFWKAQTLGVPMKYQDEAKRVLDSLKARADSEVTPTSTPAAEAKGAAVKP